MGEEEWNEGERFVKNVEWFDYYPYGRNKPINGKYAIVGDLMIAIFFIPSIEKLFGKRYNMKLGMGENNMEWINRKFKTEEEAILYVEDWWEDIVKNITAGY